MTIRDRVRRALRKSEASDTIPSTESNSTTAHTSQSSNDGPQLEKTSSRLARVLTFGSSDSKEKDKERAEKRASKAAQTRRRTHPRDRPLTSQNLRHQEMLAGFSMTFGASDPAQIETMSFVGVSPCCTRRGSLDLSRGSCTSFSNASSGTDSSREE